MDIQNQLLNEPQKNSELDKRYCATINRLQPEHRKMVFLLIYHYYVINVLSHDTININNRKSQLPYSGKIGVRGKGICFDGSFLPLELQRIIVKYIETVTN
jgi:hypothetical protein